MPAFTKKLLKLASKNARYFSNLKCVPNYNTTAPHQLEKSANFGLLFDIDGVVLRGKKPIPEAIPAFQRLVDRHGKFKVPTVFVTNAGNCLRQAKADQLSDVLNIKVNPEQVMLSHSPLKMFKDYHKKFVLLSGQGPVEEIAKNLGFTNFITMEELRHYFPNLDMVDHQRRPSKESYPELDEFPRIEAVVLFGEPVRWETNLQLLVDVLLTNGTMHGPVTLPTRNSGHLPILACNMDLQWMSEGNMPRFAHGMFMHCLESVYLKMTGQQLIYSALMGKPSEITYYYAEHLVNDQAKDIGLKNNIDTLYAIGDNPMADICGANLYNRRLNEENSHNDAIDDIKKSQLASQIHTAQPWRQVHASMRNLTTKASDDFISRDATGLNKNSGIQKYEQTVKQCKSVLVCTGVYSHSCSDSTFDIPPVFHGPRDMEFDDELFRPTHVTANIETAVDLIFNLQNFRE